MGLLLEVKNLSSRLARKNATGGKRRVISSLLAPKDKDKHNFWGFLNSLIGGTLKALTTGVQWTLSNVLGFIIGGIQAVWNFNWNVTDKDLDAQVKQARLGLIGVLGTTIGAAVAEVFCGAIPGAIIMSFNEPLGQYVLKELGEQALAEMTGHLTALVQATFQTVKVAAFSFLYKNTRQAWRGSDADLRRRLKKNGVSAKKIQKALDDRNKPWSFASAVQEKLDSGDGEGRKVFLESAYNQFGSTCLEAGYAIVGAVDAFHAQQANASDTNTIEIDFTNVNQPVATVIKPDKKN